MGSPKCSRQAALEDWLVFASALLLFLTPCGQICVPCVRSLCHLCPPLAPLICGRPPPLWSSDVLPGLPSPQSILLSLYYKVWSLDLVELPPGRPTDLLSRFAPPQFDVSFPLLLDWVSHLLDLPFGRPIWSPDLLPRLWPRLWSPDFVARVCSPIELSL